MYRGAHGDVKIMLIEIIGKIPLLGFGIWFFDFIFMKQKWEKDKSNVEKHILKAKNPDIPLWFLLFPEGTLNTPGNVEKSKNYAKKVKGLSSL